MAMISVIVPIYKVEAYLPRCIDSILNQTFPDFELILVDDGSPDHCHVICDEYAKKNARIHVIHQQNNGLAAARNAGIDWVFANSKSDYLAFIDSDDWVHPFFLEWLYNAAKNGNTDISVCNYEIVNTENCMPQYDCFNYKMCDALDFYATKGPLGVIACNKLYCNDLFRDIRFPVGELHEDEFITYKLMFESKKIAYINQPLYYYFQNPKSIMHTFSLKHLVYIDVVKEQYQFLQKHGSILVQKAMMQKRLYSYVYCLENIVSLRKKNRKQYESTYKKLLLELKKLLIEQTQISLVDYPNAYQWIHPIKTRFYLIHKRIQRFSLKHFIKRKFGKIIHE